MTCHEDIDARDSRIYSSNSRFHPFKTYTFFRDWIFGHYAREFLANSLLDNFLPEAVDLIRPMVFGDELSPDEMDLGYHLITACTIMGATFPEYERWYEEALKDNFGWHDYTRDRIRQNFRETAEEEEWDEDDDLEENDCDEEDLEEEPPPIPFPSQRKSVGRNDPCPCGSAKKYKKCCLSKDQARGSWLN